MRKTNKGGAQDTHPRALAVSSSERMDESARTKTVERTRWAVEISGATGWTEVFISPNRAGAEENFKGWNEYGIARMVVVVERRVVVESPRADSSIVGFSDGEPKTL